MIGPHLDGYPAGEAPPGLGRDQVGGSRDPDGDATAGSYLVKSTRSTAAASRMSAASIASSSSSRQIGPGKTLVDVSLGGDPEYVLKQSAKRPRTSCSFSLSGVCVSRPGLRRCSSLRKFDAARWAWKPTPGRSRKPLPHVFCRRWRHMRLMAAIVPTDSSTAPAFPEDTTRCRHRPGFCSHVKPST